MKLKIYLAQKMTGLTCRQIVKKAEKAVAALESAGLEVWSPVLEEKVPKSNKRLTVLSKEDLLDKWMVDKKIGLRKCHVFLDLDGDLHSEGMNVERGHVRWYLWRPTVRIKKPGYVYSISNIEDDVIAHSISQAARIISRRWGTRSKWIKWKLSHVLIGIPKLIWIQIKSLFI